MRIRFWRKRALVIQTIATSAPTVLDRYGNPAIPGHDTVYPPPIEENES